jgi:hypothetical protein
MRKEEVEKELAKYGYVKTVSVPRGVIDMHDKGFEHRVILWRDDWEKLTPRRSRADTITLRSWSMTKT